MIHDYIEPHSPMMRVHPMNGFELYTQSFKYLFQMKTIITEQLIRQIANEEENSKVFKVDISNRLLDALPSLRAFNKMRYLQVSFNLISRMQNLDCLPELRELHFSNNELTSICSLENNKLLTVLDLTNNRIEKIDNIGHLIKLETLTIQNNRIEKVVGIEGLKDLKHLNLSGNKLISIDSLPVFSKLESLEAENNLITKIPSRIFANSFTANHKSTSKLVRLNLGNNQLKQVSFLTALPNIEWVNVSRNRIEKLVFPQNTVFNNLEYLDVSCNQLEELPMIRDVFPELSIFLFANNCIRSEYELIRFLAGSESLVEIDFRQNPMDSKQFEETVHEVYNFDRINCKDFNDSGTRYYKRANEIKQDLTTGVWAEMEDDEEDRKIKMSGFYSEDLETQMTGMKPNRPSSPRKSKVLNRLDDEDFNKAYQEIRSNDMKISMLRQQCLDIFKRNGIGSPVQDTQQPEASRPSCSSSPLIAQEGLITEPGMLSASTEHNKTLSEFQNKNEDQAKKWKQLKNRQKSFNIRGVMGRASLRKTREASSGKVQQPSRQLMRTQLCPVRPSNDPVFGKTFASRPLSAKKKIS